MKKVLATLTILAIAAGSYAATHVFWYKATQKGYNLQANPGPNLAAGATVHEGMTVTATLNQRNNAQEASWVFGSGLDDGQGRCGVVWVKDLCDASGTVTSAKARAEFRDGWSSNAFCNAGPIAIRCGVVDFQGNIDAHGSVDLVPETATWADGLYPLSPTMGFSADVDPVNLKAQETINYTAPAGRTDGGDAVLDKVFAEVDVTDQVNWILANPGQHAIVFLVTLGQGSIGKVNTYSAENAVLPMGGDAPWTTDGNSFHLLCESSDLVIGAEQAAVAPLTGVALGQNQPNPFTGSTSIAYSTGASKSGSVKIYGPDGKLVYTQSVTGQGNLTWNAGNKPMGLYVCRLTAGNKTVSRTLVLMK